MTNKVNIIKKIIVKGVLLLILIIPLATLAQNLVIESNNGKLSFCSGGSVTLQVTITSKSNTSAITNISMNNNSKFNS